MPCAIITRAVALTIWLADHLILAHAWNQVKPVPIITAIRTPSQAFPVIRVKTIEVKAPISMMPSSAMLVTPVISLYVPPRAAKIKGVAESSVSL